MTTMTNFNARYAILRQLSHSPEGYTMNIAQAKPLYAIVDRDEINPRTLEPQVDVIHTGNSVELDSGHIIRQMFRSRVIPNTKSLKAEYSKSETVRVKGITISVQDPDKPITNNVLKVIDHTPGDRVVYRDEAAFCKAYSHCPSMIILAFEGFSIAEQIHQERRG